MVRNSGFESQTDHQLLFYDRVSSAGDLRRQVFQMEYRYIFRYEAELLLDEAGLRVRGLYGGYNMEPYESASQRMVFVAEKR